MKYIRTKDDRIIKIPNKYQEIVYDDKIIISVDKIINGVKGQAIINGFVDKKTDTIEELCDEFVYNKMTFKTLEETLDYAPIGSDIYGAIWTDKGLIYVAKMNKKGELELL